MKAPRKPASAAALLASTLAIAACGQSGAEFDERSFIAAANAHDAGLVVGAPLESLREGQSAYELRFMGAGPGVEAAGSTDVHGGGTLMVTGSADAARAEYERCEAAGTLVCFRAANIAFYFGGTLAPADLERVGSALEAMAR